MAERAAESWFDALTGLGPLASAARSFVARTGGDLPALRGARGLAWLARRIDAHASQDASVQEDAAFVEGAGALLGAILIDHAGDGAHAARDGVHRVRVGARGFYDPFAAIERALDADSARESLVTDVAIAEAEAREASGVGLAAATFERILAEQRPDLQVVDRFERRAWLTGEIEVDLGRAIDASEGQGAAALERSLAKLVSMLPGGSASRGVERDEAMRRLVPRVVRSEALADVGEGVFLRELAHGASIALLLAYDDRARFVREVELTGWGLTADDALTIARENLASRSENARFAGVDGVVGTLVVARSGDGLDAARLLLPGLHSVLAPELGPRFLVAVPHRDALYACADEPTMRAVIEGVAADASARAPHAITAGLFAVDAHGVRPA